MLFLIYYDYDDSFDLVATVSEKNENGYYQTRILFTNSPTISIKIGQPDSIHENVLMSLQDYMEICQCVK